MMRTITLMMGVILLSMSLRVSPASLSSECSMSEDLASVPTLRVVKYLDKICDDCFHLYREPEIYDMCTSDCFGSGYFVGCMDALLIREEERKEAAVLARSMQRVLLPHINVA